eukprot:COSAG06_NODE_532_length_14551_cov_16.536466_10_plen_221_part_00
MDRLEEGRARQLARYWRGEAETKGWVCIASCAGAGLASGLLLPTAGLLYVVERWREFNSDDGDKESALAAAAKAEAAAKEIEREAAAKAKEKDKQKGSRANKPEDAFLTAAARPPPKLRKKRAKPGAVLRCLACPCARSPASHATIFDPAAHTDTVACAAATTRWHAVLYAVRGACGAVPRRWELHALCFKLPRVVARGWRHSPAPGLAALLRHAHLLGC